MTQQRAEESPGEHNHVKDGMSLFWLQLGGPQTEPFLCSRNPRGSFKLRVIPLMLFVLCPTLGTTGPNYIRFAHGPRQADRTVACLVWRLCHCKIPCPRSTLPIDSMNLANPCGQKAMCRFQCENPWSWLMSVLIIELSTSCLQLNVQQGAPFFHSHMTHLYSLYMTCVNKHLAI